MTNLEQARLRAGLNKTEMSKLFNIPYKTVQSWDLGYRRPPEWAEALLIKELNNIAKNKERTKNMNINEVIRSICGAEAAININKSVSDYIDNADIQKLLLAVYCAENGITHNRLDHYQSLCVYENTDDISACARDYANGWDYSFCDDEEEKAEEYNRAVENAEKCAEAIYGVVVYNKDGNFEYHSLSELDERRIETEVNAFIDDFGPDGVQSLPFYGVVIDTFDS